MKILNGAEIASYMKVNQAHTVKALNANGIYPKLVIIRDSESPVISKYVELKKAYGDDIGIGVEDWCREDVAGAIEEANSDTSVHGLIVQLPLNSELSLDEILGKIIPKKDVDGLNSYSSGDIRCFDSATATAINWLLSAYDIPLSNLKSAVTVSGPTPPTFGVMAERSARSRTSSATSPTSTPPSLAVPASTIMAPDFTRSFVIKCGEPVALTMTSKFTN